MEHRQRQAVTVATWVGGQDTEQRLRRLLCRYERKVELECQSHAGFGKRGEEVVQDLDGEIDVRDARDAANGQGKYLECRDRTQLKFAPASKLVC